MIITWCYSTCLLIYHFIQVVHLFIPVELPIAANAVAIVVVDIFLKPCLCSFKLLDGDPGTSTTTILHQIAYHLQP
jgi:hypothetical protein